MRCEVIAVGTELLLGQIVDTNSAFIGEQLSMVGIDSFFQSKVGDNRLRIAQAIQIALGRSDAVIVCGGLGPTQDDITRDAIADVMGVPLVRDPLIEDRIRAMFMSRGRQMPSNNLRQAEVPAGASVLPVQPGTAPGIRATVAAGGQDKVIYALPGVPWEMQEMLVGAVLPDLSERAGLASVIGSRVIRTWGHSESALAERLAPYHDELDQSGRATLAFLASGIEGLKVRLTTRADSHREVQRTLGREVDRVASLLGDAVFSTDDESMEEVVLALCESQGLTLGTAESVTGGLIASRLTEVAGSSRVFRGAVVSYASEVKFDLLGVRPGPVICDEAAGEMALGACRVLGCDVSVAVTGVAGPDPQEGHGPGTVFCATCVDGEVRPKMLRLPGDRRRVRQFACISVLDLLRMRLSKRV